MSKKFTTEYCNISNLEFHGESKFFEQEPLCSSVFSVVFILFELSLCKEEQI